MYLLWVMFVQGRCQRTDPPCKYLHPPQHLKEQLLQNGRNNLIMRNLNQLQCIQPLAPTAALYSFVSTCTTYIQIDTVLYTMNQGSRITHCTSPDCACPPL